MQFVEPARPEHPTLLDSRFVVAGLYNTKNVPACFWIDEEGRIMRANDPIYIQRRNRETGETTVNEKYLNAVRDWVANGPASRFVTPPERTAGSIGQPDNANELAMAEFRLAVLLNDTGHKEDAVEHFKRAHELKPDNWNFKRQAWNLGNIEADYGTTFQQEMQKGIPFYPPLDLPD
jgi:hypothetical protein